MEELLWYRVVYYGTFKEAPYRRRYDGGSRIYTAAAGTACEA